MPRAAAQLPRPSPPPAAPAHRARPAPDLQARRLHPPCRPRPRHLPARPPRAWPRADRAGADRDHVSASVAPARTACRAGRQNAARVPNTSTGSTNPLLIIAKKLCCSHSVHTPMSLPVARAGALPLCAIPSPSKPLRGHSESAPPVVWAVGTFILTFFSFFGRGQSLTLWPGWSQL